MRAINSYIIIDKIKDGYREVGGLLLSENLDEDNRYLRAKVVSTGDKVEGIKNKDIIHYDKHSGHSITWDGKLYQVIRSQDVVLVE